MLETRDKNVLKFWYYWIILYLSAGFNTIIIILCSAYTILFMKNVFSAKIWFMKTSTRILIYESRVLVTIIKFIEDVKFVEIDNFHYLRFTFFMKESEDWKVTKAICNYCSELRYSKFMAQIRLWGLKV